MAGKYLKYVPHRLFEMLLHYKISLCCYCLTRERYVWHNAFLKHFARQFLDLCDMTQMEETWHCMPPKRCWV